MANATMDKKQWNKKKLYKLSIIIILLVVLIFFGKCVQETLTDTHGVFFLEYDSKQRVTRIYEYSSEYNEPIIIATVDGWYHSAKIDKNKEYIIGFRGSLFEMTIRPAEVVRVSVQNGTSEVYLSNAEIQNIIGNTFSSWDSTEALIDDEGEKIFFGRKRVLYEQKSNKTHDVEAIFEEKGISVSDFCELQDETLWVANKEGDVLEYNFETEELVKVLSDIPGKVSVFDKEKIAYVDFNTNKLKKRLCVYDGKESRCIGRTGWNTYYRGANNSYQLCWDASGDFLFYMTDFPGIVGGNNIKLKVYNFRTNSSHTFYHKEFMEYEFVKSD